MKCDKCGKNMIREYEHYIQDKPRYYPWYWWCACGNTKEGGADPEMTHEELRQRAWKEANAKSV